MGIIASAFGAGLGQGMANAGAYLSQESSKEEDRQARLELARERLEEQKAVALERVRAASSGSKSGGLAALQAAGGTPADVGLEFGAGSQAPFTSTVPTRTDDDPANSDRTSRMGLINDASASPSANTVVDESGYRASEQRRKDNNINVLTKVEDPDKYEALQKGIQQESVTRLAGMLDRVKDPAAREVIKSEIADLKASLDKGDRFEIGGDTRLNKATGAMKTTELGAAKAGESRDKGSAAGSEAKSKEFQALQQERISADEKVKQANKNIQDGRNRIAKGLSKAELAKEEADIATERAALATYQKISDDIQGQLRDFRGREREKGGGTKSPTITPVKDNARPGAAPSRASEFKVIRN